MTLRRRLLLLVVRKGEEELAFEPAPTPDFQYPHGKTVTHVGPYGKTVIGTGPNSTSISVPE